MEVVVVVPSLSPLPVNPAVYVNYYYYYYYYYYVNYY